MALIGPRRGDIRIHWNGDEHFGLRWHRLLLQLPDMPAVHLGPLLANHLGPLMPNAGPPAADGHVEHTFLAPIDENSAPPADAAGPGDGPVGGGTAPAPAADAPASDGGLLLDNYWHPPYFSPEPLVDGTGNPSIPGDAPPPEGFIPKSEAVIWSGPAIMEFTADPHGTDSDATPDGTDVPIAPDSPDAVTRADLDPVLAAMGDGHAALFDDTGGGDLGTAFLPPDSNDPGDLGHGPDLGFAFTPPPLPPPPPEVI